MSGASFFVITVEDFFADAAIHINTKTRTNTLPLKVL